MNKAVIFDMDGVISDTQNSIARIESDMLRRYDVLMSPDEIIKKYAGQKDIVQFTEIFAEANIDIDVDMFIAEKETFTKIHIETSLLAIPGSQEYISLLSKNRIPLAVASGAASEIIELILEKLAVRPFFSAIAAANDVKKGKPDPEIFLLAAEKLGVSPEFCIVIEDAKNGIQAAKAAGMKAIGITTTHTRNDLKEADLIVDSFSELSIDTIKSL